jgi:hypothetical protein
MFLFYCERTRISLNPSSFSLGGRRCSVPLLKERSSRSRRTKKNSFSPITCPNQQFFYSTKIISNFAGRLFFQVSSQYLVTGYPSSWGCLGDSSAWGGACNPSHQSSITSTTIREILGHCSHRLRPQLQSSYELYELKTVRDWCKKNISSMTYLAPAGTN